MQNASNAQPDKVAQATPVVSRLEPGKLPRPGIEEHPWPIFGASTALCLTFLLIVGPLPWAASSATLHALLQDMARVETSVGPAGREATTQVIRDYFQSAGSEILDTRGFSFRERQHFLEVKSAIDEVKHGARWLQISLLLALGALIGLNRSSPSRSLLVLERSARLTAVLLASTVVIGLLGLALGFDSGFVALHRIVFADGNWILPPESLTIALFPRSFFVAGAQLYGLWIGLAATALGTLSWTLQRMARRRARRGRSGAASSENEGSRPEKIQNR